MELPSFEGTDAVSWIARANQYFLVHNTPVERRVQVALIALAGPAMAWVQVLLRRSPLIAWDEFSRELKIRFGTSAALDEYEALHTTTQVGSLDDYIAAFESRLAQLPELTERQYLSFFLGGLKPHIRCKSKIRILLAMSTQFKWQSELTFWMHRRSTLHGRIHCPNHVRHQIHATARSFIHQEQPNSQEMSQMLLEILDHFEAFLMRSSENMLLPGRVLNVAFGLGRCIDVLPKHFKS